MTDDLKRCPFCGGEPKVFHHQNKWIGETWHIECLDDNCGCGTCHHESADIAATVWNRRIEAQAAEIERLREAGNDLGFYAGHEDACDCVKGWAKGPCNCGYTEAWQAWHSLAGKAEQ